MFVKGEINMKFCTSRGKEIKEGIKFCESCGASVIDSNSELSDKDNVSTDETAHENESAIPCETDLTSTKTEDVKKRFNINAIPKKYFVITAVALITVIIFIVIIFSNSGPDFKKLYKEYCNSIWAELGEDGSYLSIDTNPFDEENNGVAYSTAYYAIENLNKELKLPDSLLKDMGNTTGSDGRQTREFDNVAVSWRYHPDYGLEVTYKKK